MSNAFISNPMDVARSVNSMNVAQLIVQTKFVGVGSLFDPRITHL